MSALRGLAFGLMFLGACCMGFARKVPRGKSVVIKGADVSKAQADGGESGEGDSGGAAVSLVPRPALAPRATLCLVPSCRGFCI